jgi:hypothetical protein
MLNSGMPVNAWPLPDSVPAKTAFDHSLEYIDSSRKFFDNMSGIVRRRVLNRYALQEQALVVLKNLLQKHH